MYNEYMINIAIFGCGKISKRIASSIKNVEGLRLYGFASKDRMKALKLKDEYFSLFYGTYDTFLNDPLCDAVYIATYNPSHYELIEKCIMHGKHVICEKPMLSSIEEVNKVYALAKEHNVFLMEALKSNFSPTLFKLKELLDEEIVGKVKHVYISFVRGGGHPVDHWIYDKKTGGALKDLGSYTFGTLNYLFGLPKEIETTTNATDFKADSLAISHLKYDTFEADSVVSHDVTTESSITITCKKGYIKAINYWKDNKITVVNEENEEKDIEVDFIDDFHYELEHFRDCVNNKLLESPIMSKETSINVLKLTTYKKETNE